MNYNIHNFVAICVCQNVSREIRETIEFQIGNFRSNRDPFDSIPYKITIQKYKSVTLENTDPILRFHTVYGVAHRLFDDHKNRIAIERTDVGFSIYTDSPAFLINQFINLLLLKKGITMIHAAGVVGPDGSATLFPGPGGVGKTAILGSAVSRHDHKVLGDDIILLGEDRLAYSFPRGFVLKEYHREIYPEVFSEIEKGSLSEKATKQNSTKQMVFKFLRENLPFHGLAKSIFNKCGSLDDASRWIRSHSDPVDFLTVPVEKIFGPDSVKERALVRRVVFLERHLGQSFAKSILSTDALVDRLMAIIHHEWADYMKMFFAMQSLEICSSSDYFQKMESIMRSALKSIQCELVQIPDGATPKELEDFVLGTP